MSVPRRLTFTYEGHQLSLWSIIVKKKNNIICVLKQTYIITRNNTFDKFEAKKYRYVFSLLNVIIQGFYIQNMYTNLSYDKNSSRSLRLTII